MNYEEAEILISKAEADQAKQTTTTIDLAMALGSVINIIEYDPKKAELAVSVADNISNIGALERSDAGKTAAPIAAKQTAVQQAAQPSAQQQAQAAAQQAQAPSPARESKPMFSASEISSITNQIKAKFRPVHKEEKTVVAQPVETINIDKFVLPSLSLQDQLSELEKISIGLDSGVFSGGELSIITSEIRALAEFSRRKQDTGLDRSLVELRDRRLKEIINKLGLK